MAEQPRRRKPTAIAAAENAPWLPPEYEKADAFAIKALAVGQANEHQQRRAMEFIVKRLCGTYDLPYRPGGEDGKRDTDFALGRMFVGQQIVKLINADPARLRSEDGTG